MIRSTRELRRRVDRIHFQCLKRIDGNLIGSYDSTFKGQGIEFEETRPYLPGDDVRWIDWRVTARFSRPYVKLFRQQRQLTIHLLVDGSGSLGVPGRGRTPAQAAIEIAGTMAMLAASEQDRVGLTLFTDRIEHFVAPASDPTHAARVLRDLVCWKPAGIRSQLRPALEPLLRGSRSRSLIVLLSDFVGDVVSPENEKLLRATASQHELIPVVIRHPSETRLPRCGLLRVRDPETGIKRWIDTRSSRQRKRLQQAARVEQQHLDRMFSQLRCLPLRHECDQDVAVSLRGYFHRRGQLR
ncbi:DUF58 domain-containing protein [Roseiconus nitratireducens]|uniref:DUF58 domain-containing protein n=1 Tax=Roseiconus nitratireducens TaxID=2605748 RepID=A0A5M6DAU5_9BACT|nr:DUF58 domain-containing protein [Roseiconus nitratireducens]KAA5542255.1 DUF58 domain-containing protein [Roseiconus nitratireducens]